MTRDAESVVVTRDLLERIQRFLVGPEPGPGPETDDYFAVVRAVDRLLAPEEFDGCRHSEHAIRPGFGRVGRYFEGLNDQAGKWERCPARIDGAESVAPAWRDAAELAAVKVAKLENENKALRELLDGVVDGYDANWVTERLRDIDT